MVTELVKSENSYQSAFRSVRESSPTVAWLELVRSSAMDRFEQLGFPSVREEDWKYTNLATLAKEEFAPVTSGLSEARDIERFTYPETAEAHLVVVDGFLREDLSTKTGLGEIARPSGEDGAAAPRRPTTHDQLVAEARRSNRPLGRPIRA